MLTRAVPDGPALDAVRPDQVRDPAAGAASGRARRRQRAGRDRHLAGDPDRHDRRRLGDGERRARPRHRSSCIAIAVAGYLVSRSIPPAPPTAPDLKFNWNPFTETVRVLGFVTKNRTVFNSVLGISWFWFFGGVFTMQLPNYTKIFLGGTESVSILVLALFSIGVGAGSLLCEKLSGRRVEIGLVPFGSIGLTLFGLDLYFARPAAADAARAFGVRIPRRARQLAHRRRFRPGRRVRRLLHRAAVRARAEPRAEERAFARDRRQQHHQRALHRRRGRVRHRARRRWPHDSADFPRSPRCSTPRSRSTSTRWCPNS